MNFDERCFVLVTGASRGLGRSIAAALSKEVGADSTFLLLSRATKDLEETKRMLIENSGEKKLKVILKSVDNETADKNVFESCLDEGLAGEEDLNRHDFLMITMFPSLN
jgi:sepiapterin reductase